MEVVVRFFNRVKDFLLVSTCCTSNDKIIIMSESSPMLQRRAMASVKSSASI